MKLFFFIKFSYTNVKTTTKKSLFSNLLTICTVKSIDLLLTINSQFELHLEHFPYATLLLVTDLI